MCRGEFICNNALELTNQRARYIGYKRKPFKLCLFTAFILPLLLYTVNYEISFYCHPREVALVIIQHNDWRQAMRNKTKDGTAINTPMRKLIKKLPGERIIKYHSKCKSVKELIHGLRILKS